MINSQRRAVIWEVVWWLGVVAFVALLFGVAVILSATPQ